MRTIIGVSERQREFIKVFEPLERRRNAWEIWEDFVTMAGCSLANSIGRQSPQYEARERLYVKTAQKYDKADIGRFSEMLAITVNALEEDPFQDFLGRMFMALELGNHWKGQFFTPISVCKAMAAMNLAGAKAAIDEKGWISISDPACGAGALLIAAACELDKLKINYQIHALFVAQDVDFTAAMMCYIQLSLLGCAGYVICGDTLAPDAGIQKDGSNIWYTPMYFRKEWAWRRLFQRLGQITKTPRAVQNNEKRIEKPKCRITGIYYYYFAEENSK